MQTFADTTKSTATPAANLQQIKNDAHANEPELKLPSSLFFQPKLTVGSADDPLEKEADDMADKVMRMQMPRPVNFSSAKNSVHRKCAHCEEEEKKLQRKESHSDSTSVAPPIVHDVINSSYGKSLDEGTRSFMEPRFGYDFSNVRIHDSELAAKSANSINALAYTSGNNVVFNSGQYNTNSNSGRRLLAHELTHVVQQNSNIATKRVQRLVRTSLVTCPAGQNPHGADRHASTLLTNAINLIDAAVAVRVASPANPDVVTISNAMRTAFRLNPGNNSNWNDPAPHFGIPLIRRRVEAVRNYIDGVVFTITCGAAGAVLPLAGCGTVQCNGPEAWSCHVNPTDIVLCPPFWALGSSNQRARTFMHEIFHITFRSIDDWANPDSSNAHCYAQFVALLNGFNSPALFRCH